MDKKKMKQGRRRGQGRGEWISKRMSGWEVVRESEKEEHGGWKERRGRGERHRRVKERVSE